MVGSPAHGVEDHRLGGAASPLQGWLQLLPPPATCRWVPREMLSPGLGWDCPSLSAPCRTCLLPSPVILALWFLWVQVTPGVVPAGHERKTSHNGNNQPLESLPQGSGASPSVGYFQGSAGQGAGLSCLDRTFGKKGCTKGSSSSLPTWYSMIVCSLFCSDLSVSISDLLSSSEVTPWVLL